MSGARAFTALDEAHDVDEVFRERVREEILLVLNRLHRLHVRDRRRFGLDLLTNELGDEVGIADGAAATMPADSAL